MKKKSRNFKLYYYIWGILLVVLVYLTLFVEAASNMLPVTAFVLFGGAVMFRGWKNAVVEIEIKDGVAHMEMLDGKQQAIYINAIVQIRETTNGTHLRFADGEEVRTRKGKNKIIIRNGESVTNEFRRKDFPYAQFVEQK